jgi:hypothetical protein
MKLFLCSLLLVFVFSTSYGQMRKTTFSTIKLQTTKPEKVKDWKFAFQFDNRFSSINHDKVTIFGAKVGLQFQNKVRFGIGGSFILNPIIVNVTNRKGKIVGDTKINFWYLSLFGDWILFKNKRWETFVTEQIGFGKPELIQERKGVIVQETDPNLYVNELSAQANYKITSWIGLGAGVGYRNILNNESVLISRFNAPIYIFKAIIYPESILKK